MSYPLSKGDRKYPCAEYMAMEETSVEKHDIYHGEIFAAAGRTTNHNSIIVNLALL